MKVIAHFLKNFTFVSNDDSLDWKNYGVQSIINTVVNHKHLGNGSIILCHNGAKYTAQALDDMIKGLKEKGYEIVPIFRRSWFLFFSTKSSMLIVHYLISLFEILNFHFR